MNNEVQAKRKYDKELESIVEFCKNKPETVFRTWYLAKKLDVEKGTREIMKSLSKRYESLGLRKVYDSRMVANYGYSEICGPGICFGECYESNDKCRDGRRNEKLKFYEKEKLKRELEASVKCINFSDLKGELTTRGVNPLDILSENIGVAYVITVEREMCSDCQKQEPLFKELALNMRKKYADRVDFLIVNSSFNGVDKREAEQAKEAFSTIAFPLFMIGVKEDEGKVRETYRSIENTPMREIKRNIIKSVEIADSIKSRKNNY